jgi:GNAT superfamily N-acetyltransferase
MITYAVEPWPSFIEEAKPLLPIHWKELALDQDKVPLDPRYDFYDAQHAQGSVMVVTVRKAGRLIGYFIGFVGPGLHYKTCLTLQMDIFYILPEHRGSGAGFVLFKEVEKEAKRRGIQRLFAGSKMHKDASWLFEKLGYEKADMYYTQWLGA